ncbi:MAG: hypothetical protein JSV51_02235 [Candidatus Bathyarchaeota archaeon]|nr:MAG: hypothetical protein JSV51_02235 [Candidatus Bathyarchaeota archaeon]
MKTNSSPISPQKRRDNDDHDPMTYATQNEKIKSRKRVEDSLWLSRKMVDDGCTLEQTLHVMEERCKNCSFISPALCVNQCTTWMVKRELRETENALSREGHDIQLLNAIKNERRITMLAILRKPLSVEGIQKELRGYGFNHSQETVGEYLRPLIWAGLIRESNGRFRISLYGKKVLDAMVRHNFKGQLPAHSEGYEERVLRSLLTGDKTRSELYKVIPKQGLSRVLKRLRENGLILDNALDARVFYFRTKRALSMERISPTQRRICESIPDDGVSATGLANDIGISLRRVYKYLRTLRGKKLVFRRVVPLRFKLSLRGRQVAKFLDEVATIE